MRGMQHPAQILDGGSVQLRYALRRDRERFANLMQRFAAEVVQRKHIVLPRRQPA
jgi:hypothetical protein